MTLYYIIAKEKPYEIAKKKFAADGGFQWLLFL